MIYEKEKPATRGRGFRHFVRRPLSPPATLFHFKSSLHDLHLVSDFAHSKRNFIPTMVSQAPLSRVGKEELTQVI